MECQHYFDFNKALEQSQAGQGLTGKDGILTPLIKQLTEAALNAELEQNLQQEPSPNRKNGYTKKTVQTSVGQFELETPRDREGYFEPPTCQKKSDQTHAGNQSENPWTLCTWHQLP